MEKRDYYETLGVDKTSDAQAIKKAYRKLAKEYHPDRNSDSGAADKFKEISEAYEVLSDDSKRKAYDQFGHAGTQGFGGYSGPQNGYSDTFDMGDIFSQFFGGGGGGFDFSGFSTGSRRGPRSTTSRGTDLRYRINLDFMESMEGGEYEIKIQRSVKCEKCDGTGSEDKVLNECSTCGGQGQVQKVQNSFLGQMVFVTECPDCHGVGKKPNKPCSECNSTGLKQKEENAKINIPAGVRDGMTLRFRGSGSMGVNGGEPGDLYVEIAVEPHEIFERRGDDIYSEVSIPIHTAVLGDEVYVDTIDGDVKLKIPSGTPAGTVFKIKQKGSLIVGKEGSRGDQYVKVDLEVPKKLSRDEKKMWQKLRDVS